MCSDVVVQVDNLSKCYQIYKKPHQRLLQSIFRGKKTFYENFWALRGVSFKVHRGQTVGIVGRNGSGKTTLLQLICGTLLPSSGVCKVNGRIAALLALGAGFNSEYTGDENIYLYASLLGLSKRDVEERYASICEFADIGDFIEQPVKKYSSGMYMRLAFSIAIHVEPDILIVDEALAVGDEAFQRKCYAKLEELKKKGMALLFVSHSANSVINLCDKAILLEKGEMLAVGEPKSVISAYHRLLFSPPHKMENVIQEVKNKFASGDVYQYGDDGEINKEAPKQKAYFLESMVSNSVVFYESKGAEIKEPCVFTLDGEKVNVLCKGESYLYTYKVHFNKGCHKVRFGMLFKTITGIEIAGAVTSTLENSIVYIDAGAEFNIVFYFVCNLNPGVYFMNAGVKGVVDNEEIYLHRILDALMIRVMPEEEQVSTALVDLGIRSEIKEL